MTTKKKITIAMVTLMVATGSIVTSYKAHAVNEDSGGKKKLVACVIADEGGVIGVGNTCLLH
jgi:hypothetical protein